MMPSAAAAAAGGVTEDANAPPPARPAADDDAWLHASPPRGGAAATPLVAAAPARAPPRGALGWARLLRSALASPFTNVAALRDAPSELWVCFWLQLIIALNYFTLTLILTEYLTVEFGVSDVRAGLVYGLFGTLTSLYAFPAGVLSDYIGVRWSLFLAAVLNCVGRLVLALTVRRATAEAMLFSLLPLANGVDWGILSTGVRRYTPPRARAVAFAVLASFLAFGQLLSGVLRDAFVLPAAADAQGVHREGQQLSIHGISGHRALLLFGAAASALELGLSGFASPGPGAARAAEAAQQAEAESGERSAAAAHHHQSNGGSAAQAVVRATTLRARLRVPPRALLADTLRCVAFWRFALLLLLCSLVRMVLQYVTAAMPKYLNRVFGPNVPVGALVAIQPALCVFLVPLVTAAAAHVPPLRMIAAGAAVSTAALLWLVADVAIWAVVVFMVTLAVGEAMWSPRLFEYTAAASPAGASCTWSALGAMPMFLAKLPTGLLSGALLEKFVPAEGPRRPRVMWACVFACTAAGPLAMVLLHRVIAGPTLSEAQRAEQELKAAVAAASSAFAAGAPAEATAAVTFSGEPVELAEAFLHGEFDEGLCGAFGDGGDAAPATPGTLRGADPANPFA